MDQIIHHNLASFQGIEGGLKKGENSWDGWK